MANWTKGSCLEGPGMGVPGFDVLGFSISVVDVLGSSSSEVDAPDDGDEFLGLPVKKVASILNPEALKSLEAARFDICKLEIEVHGSVQRRYEIN